MFEEDLEHYPINGWSMFALTKALRFQGDEAGAAQMSARFETVWQLADVSLATSIL